jgi:trk system potassium uptake protein TrkA
MRIAVAGSGIQADFLISFLKEKKHVIVAICDDRKQAGHLSEAYDIPVVYGDPTKQYVLDDADIDDFDVLIAITQSDADNLVICQSAQRFYGVHKRVCTVNNPRNVDVFNELGVSVVISATYLIASLIERASTGEALDDAMDAITLGERSDQ